MKRSLRASQKGLEKAKKAFNCTGKTQEYLAGSVDCTRQTVWKFFKGIPIDKDVFIRLCVKLELDWREVADFEDDDFVDDDELKVINEKPNQIEEQTIAYSIVGTALKIELHKLKVIVAHLHKLTGDTSIEIIDIEKGSIRLILEGSQPGLDQLVSMFKSGQLTEVLGIPVEDVQFLDSLDSNSDKTIQTGEKKRLAFSIRGNISQTELQELKAAFTETTFNFVNAQQVYRNTLAVYAVNTYLKRHGIETDLTGSDSWNPSIQSLANIADLKVKRQGQWVKLECRPVFSDTNLVYIPAEVWHNRMGYVAVGINESLMEATLLGFTQTVTTEELSLSQFQSLNELLNCLKPPVNLSRWFDNLVEEGWQTVETLLGTPYSGLAFRMVNPARVQRGKTIQLKDHSLALILDLSKDNQQKVRIRVKVCALTSNTPLPEGLRLMVLHKTGEAFLEIQAGNTDRSIQTQPFQLTEQPEGKFTVKVVLGEESITEEFVIETELSGA